MIPISYIVNSPYIYLLYEKRDSLYTLRYLMFIVLLHIVLSYSFKLCSTQVGIIRQRVTYKTTVKIVFIRRLLNLYIILNNVKHWPTHLFFVVNVNRRPYVFTEKLSCDAVLISM